MHHFSCLLDVGADNVEAALALYTQIAQDFEADDDLAIRFVAQRSPGTPSALWLYDEDHGDPEHVIAFVLRCAEALDLGARKSLAWTDCSQWLAFQLEVGPADNMARVRERLRQDSSEST